MALIDKETICAEIERRHTYQKEMYNKTKPDGRPNDGWAESLAIMGELEELRTFLDSLPEQVNGPSRDQVGTKFAAEGLEEAAEKSASQYYVDGGYSPFPNVETAAHEAGFIAGAEWQKKRNDLETADLLAIAHLQGMEQQKSKMLEDAVEGEVTTDNRGNNVVRAGVFNKDFEYGDKVRVIVINED